MKTFMKKSMLLKISVNRLLQIDTVLAACKQTNFNPISIDYEMCE